MHDELQKIINSTLPDSIEQATLEPLLKEIEASIDERDFELARLTSEISDKNHEFKGIQQELNSKLLENRAARNRLEEFAAKQQALLNATPEAVFSFTAGGKVTQMNRAAEKFVGVPFERMRQFDVKKNLALILSLVSEPETFLDTVRTLDLDRSRKLRGYCAMKTGTVYEYNSIPEFLGNLYLGRVWCWRDVTDLKASQDLLQHQAYHDTLTNLPNRLHLIDSLRHATAIAQRNGSKIAVLFIDLDDFKKINDTEGHAVGDQFLISVSDRIRSKLRDGDTFGRLGGDEFLIILEGLNHEHEIGIAYQRIKEIFDAPLLIGNKQFFISGSIGVSQYPSDSLEPEDLIGKADMAMYRAKNSGKNTIYYFEASLEQHAQARMNLETLLRSAFENNEFYLCYQPKVDINQNTIIGMEALLRWRHQHRHTITPDRFVRIAEQIGLISQITEFVLRQICTQLSAWRNTALSKTPISMNISVNDLKTDGFLDLVLKTIREFNIPGELIEFELTEHVFIEERERTANVIKQLKKWGIEVAVDDFGTGYSCFSYLQDLDIDCLKIDKSFTQGIANSEKSAAIVKSIIDIGNNLDMTVIAEGVETESDLEYLRNLNCRCVQGYFYAKALPPEEILSLATTGLSSDRTANSSDRLASYQD